MAEPAKPKSQRRLRNAAGVTVLIALVAVIYLRLTTIDTIIVDGSSMSPTLHDLDRLLSNRRAYRHEPPQRGDIVIVEPEGPGLVEIKRIIGLPGDTVWCIFSFLFINGQSIRESYIAEPMFTAEGPFFVPPDSVFVLGDNRNSSNDSRDFGPIPSSAIRGKAFWGLLPFERWGPLERPVELEDVLPGLLRPGKVFDQPSQGE